MRSTSCALLAALTCGLWACGQEQKRPTEIDAAVFLEGKKLYARRCENCHQSNGKGMGTLYPNITGQQDWDQVACRIRKGVVVPGDKSDAPRYLMPANADLNAHQIASLLTYMGNSWGQTTPQIGPEQVGAALTACEAR